MSKLLFQNIFYATLFFSFLVPGTLQADCKFEKIIQGDELPIGIMLEWSTCVEESNSMFIIEKSEDGIDFKNIGAVKGSGTTATINEYTFLDVNAKAERLYYRLRQIDFDGSFSFSQVYTIHKKTANNFTVAHMSSITAVDNFEVSIDAFIAGKLTCELLDLSGKVIHSETMDAKKGNNNVVVDLTVYQENIYRLKLKIAEEEEVLTFKKISLEEHEKLNFAVSKDCKK